MIATWSANAVWLAGDWVMTWILNPWLLPSLAAVSKKFVAVLNTPVMSGGVQPITMGRSQRFPGCACSTSAFPPAKTQGASRTSASAATSGKRSLWNIFPSLLNYRAFLDLSSEDPVHLLPVPDTGTCVPALRYA